MAFVDIRFVCIMSISALLGVGIWFFIVHQNMDSLEQASLSLVPSLSAIQLKKMILNFDEMKVIAEGAAFDKAIKKITFGGKTKLIFKGFECTGTDFTYFQDQELVVTTSPISLAMSHLTTTAGAAHIDIKNKIVTLEGAVYTVFKK